ncbi:MAG: hypothetical protein M1831_006147 [Alyxoria varia]|nr:MAG: hypothetical protein M1831_006147 [Alyxoria varia]
MAESNAQSETAATQTRDRTAPPVSKERRQQILKVLFISLLLDLISFTFILPLFPKLLEFYRDLESSSRSSGPTVLSGILSALNTYKNYFRRPINSRYDIVLLGGALGSLFSFLQALASPVIGRLSDRHGRRRALLCSMVGNILSVALWVAATDFRTFLASRVVGGLSEGNVQLATAIAADISDDSQRGATMALVGACFSVAFTFGPAIGAGLANWQTMKDNPFGTAAGFSLVLIVTETVYLWWKLPETLPSMTKETSNSLEKDDSRSNGGVEPSEKQEEKSQPTSEPQQRTNSYLALNFIHFSFIVFFSGLEFSLSFTTYDLYTYTSSQNGRLLGFIGLIASILQASVVRRLHPLTNVRLGVASATLAFFLLARMDSSSQVLLHIAAALLAVTSATVVTGLNSLSSFEAKAGERGGKLGNHRAAGQSGRTLGPVGFCTVYWWIGRERAYTWGGLGMLGVMGAALMVLAKPRMVTAKR